MHSYTDPLLALRDFKEDFYDLVIVDIKMPKLDGLDFYIEIRKADRKVKLCFITASEKYYEPYRKEIAAILGENCFIQKPIANEQLLKVADEVIKGKTQDENHRNNTSIP